MVLEVVEKNAMDEASEATTRMKLASTEIHRIDVDSNSAGSASWDWNRIDLHTFLFSEDAPKEEPSDTLFHEIAHLIAGWGCDDFHHGRMWRRVFADLGYPEGERCHSMPRLRGTTGKPRSRTVYVYKCVGCGKRHERRRKMSDRMNYRHRRCPGNEEGYELVRSFREII